MTYRHFIALAALPLVLSACSRTDSEKGADDGVEFSVDLGGDGSKADKIKIGGDGEDSKFSIKADGFSLDVDLPSITLDSDDFDLNNVALYPGTKVTGLDVEDKDGKGGKVTLSFVAPTDTKTLTSWFEEKMKAESFEVAKSSNGLSGKTGEGDPFDLTLDSKSSKETAGKLTFSES
ncbi:hypothetical protein [Parasphingorhabdus halotolerans]|uniref:Lipoprotein n=1 Tax=Parasphingorhabdus halotolerans TaxID=2725558 RepID=A0A6H2DNF0_9SPHN|nr:hypothetical protein [Parasphingorhabdus halotolerans]QJB69186.1 hypothetical protein HF685_07770 [Parasphingorhabdus halotolerans]